MKMTKTDWENYWALRGAGWSMRRIARRFGVAASTLALGAPARHQMDPILTTPGAGRLKSLLLAWINEGANHDRNEMLPAKEAYRLNCLVADAMRLRAKLDARRPDGRG